MEKTNPKTREMVEEKIKAILQRNLERHYNEIQKKSILQQSHCIDSLCEGGLASDDIREPKRQILRRDYHVKDSIRCDAQVAETETATNGISATRQSISAYFANILELLQPNIPIVISTYGWDHLKDSAEIVASK
ncbi:hypothetical protein OROMI_020098 [Orobanche minor]